MKQMTKLALAFCLAGSMGFGTLATAAEELTESSDNFVGLIDDGIPSSPTDEVNYINNLLTVAVGTTSTIGSETYTRSNNECTPNLGGCPSAFLTGAMKDETDPPQTFDVTGYEYLLAKYDGPNFGSVVWYVADINGEVTLPGTLGGYGLSHWSLYNSTCENGGCGGEETPEPGSLALLGAGLAGLALIRRRRRS